MVSTVDRPPPNSSRIVRWITLSVSKSTLEVASSRSNILERRTRARARHNSCKNKVKGRGKVKGKDKVKGKSKG